MFYNHINIIVSFDTLICWFQIRSLKTFQLTIEPQKGSLRMYINISFIVLSLKITVLPKDKTMADKLVYIPNDYTQNYPFCRLQLMDEMFGDSP